MKRIYLILIVLVGISVSCTKNFEDWQKDEKNPAVVPGEMLFTNAQKALADQLASTNVNLNNWKYYAQHWTATTYTDEANYDIVTRSVADNVFRELYRDVLRDLKEARGLIASATVTSEEVAMQANKLLIIDIVEAYTFQRLVDIFGNVPYTQALDIDATLNPTYDDGWAIYQDLEERLQNAIDNLNTGADSYGTADLYYGGDVSAWITFAHSIKFRMAITVADKYEDVAKTWVSDSKDHTFASQDESANLVYLPAPLANTNPLYQDLVASGRNDHVAANTIVDYMNELNDPRRAVYFELNTEANGDEYVGGIYGASNSYGSYSHIGAVIHDPTFPVALMTYTEILFYKAEAAARGWSVDGTALEYYEAAIAASFEEWGVEGAADYIASEGVAWDGSTDWKKAIAMQAYLGHYQRGFEAWTTYRRLDWPVMNEAPDAVTAGKIVPTRFTFPISEQTLNKTNYYQAADAVGGDLMETKLFWDMY